MQVDKAITNDKWIVSRCFATTGLESRADIVAGQETQLGVLALCLLLTSVEFNSWHFMQHK